MRDLQLLVWLTQLGLSTALPLVGFPLLAIWLQGKFNLGSWVLWVGIIFGIVSAIDGFRSSLKAMARMSKNKKNPDPPLSFNEHD